MESSYRAKFRQAARQIKRRISPGALILLYHRVADLPHDPFRLSVTPERFAEHLQVLREYARPTTLRRVTGEVRAGRRPRRSVVVTFDDGYADNLHAARPLLEKYDVPATIFVATGRINDGTMFWWDDLADILLTPGRLPRKLALAGADGGRPRHWDMGDSADYSAESARRSRDWHVYLPRQHDPSSRQTLFRELYDHLRPLTHEVRRARLTELRAWAQTSDDVRRRQQHRSLSPEELIDFARSPLIEIGAHTVTHPQLSHLDLAAQRREIADSKRDLEEWLARPVTSFAYPHGQPSDYTAQTIDVVRENAFDCACSTSTGVVWRGSDPYQMPRLIVGDTKLEAGHWDGEALGKALRRVAFG